MVTSPLTGLSVSAIKYSDGSIVFSDALTGTDIKINYNASIKKYMLDPKLLKPRPLLTYEECADMLRVSVPRLYKLISENRLHFVAIGEKKYITEESALKCKAELSADKRSKSHGTRID